MNRDTRPAYVFANFASGGVLAGVAQGVCAASIESGTGMSFAQFCHGMSAASAGEMTGIPLFAPARDGSGRPRFTAAETQTMFETYAREWLPHQMSYGRQHLAKKRHELRSVFFRAAEKVNYYLNNDIVADTLNELLGDVALGDMLRSTYIAAHDYTAKDAATTSVMFSTEIQTDGRRRCSHDPRLPIVDPMQASMAVPGHYRSKQIEGVGHFSDMGHIHTGLAALIRFKATIPPDAPIIYVEMGTARFHNLISPKDHDLCSAFDIVSNGYLMGSTSNHSYGQAMQTIPLLLNGGAFFDLTADFDRQHYTVDTLPFSENFLDASPRNLKRIRDAVETHDGLQARLNDVKKALCENESKWRAAAMPAPLSRIATTPENGAGTWLRRLLFSNQNAPVAKVA
jgi:hypothetical protein